MHLRFHGKVKHFIIEKLKSLRPSFVTIVDKPRNYDILSIESRCEI